MERGEKMNNDLISREALKKYARTRISEEIVTNQVILKLFDELIDDAPAVEPDLSNDLISRTELKKCAIPCEIHNGALTELCVPLYQIDNAPTVEGFTKEDMSGAYNEGYMCGNKEAINSRPQGKWVAREDMDYIDENKVVHNHFMCNKCGLIHDFIDEHTSQYNFCPNCGAE